MLLTPTVQLPKKKKKKFDTALCVFCQSTKSVTLLVANKEDSDDVIKTLKLHNEYSTQQYTELFTLILNYDISLENVLFSYHSHCRQEFCKKKYTLLRSLKRQNVQVENENKVTRRTRSSISSFEYKKCLFCQTETTDRLHDIQAGIKDEELKSAFAECPVSLDVYRIRSLSAHDAMAAELKYHQKCWNKIIRDRVVEVRTDDIVSQTSEHIASIPTLSYTAMPDPTQELRKSLYVGYMKTPSITVDCQVK